MKTIKQKALSVISITLIVSILTTVAVFASEIYDITKIAGYDFADVYLNGTIGLEKDKGYLRASDGEMIPSTLNWNGTTYVPLRLMSELLGADVDWNGSILIDLKNNDLSGSEADYTKRVLAKKNVPYSNEMTFSIMNGKTAFVENMNGQILHDIDIVLDPVTGVTISNPYLLSLKKNFILTVVKDDEIIEQPFYVNDITLDSFEQRNDQWYSVLPADGDSGFYHPTIIGFKSWTGNITEDFSRLNDTMIVEGSNEGVTFTNKDSYEKQINERLTGEMSVLIADRHMFPYMVSMFPRPMQDGLMYSHALDRDTLFYTKAYLDTLGRGNLYRMDEQFLAMVDYAQDKFKLLGLTLDKKVAIAGFSASSDWANRMTMLHPDRIKFVVANLTATMPMSTYQGHDLPYPLGLSNIKDVTGAEFDAMTYKTVPQFWFVGADDTGDGTRYDDGWGNYGDRSNEWNQEGIDYRAIFGEDSIQRRVLQMAIIEELGFDKIEYVSYMGLEHDWGYRQLGDIDEFINRVDQ